MYLNNRASRARLREAQTARNNRAEIVKALSTGQVTRRELFKWGIFTATGTLAMVNGLNPYAHSSVLPSIPTGTPLSPLFGVQPFTQPLQRLREEKPVPLTPTVVGQETLLNFPSELSQLPAKRKSWHTEFSDSGGQRFVNPKTGRGPIEGRPPGEYFAHQRWLEYLPQKAFMMMLGGCDHGTRLHPGLPEQHENRIWSFNSASSTYGTLPPPLLKMRYGEPAIFRHFNRLPTNVADNEGFGSISQSTHNHNGHNASTSDGASNAHFFPGQFYDYHWSTTLARADTINTTATDPRASGPDDNGGLKMVPGDFRELQGSLWFHDHRFFYTADNVYKGHCGMLNYYSGPDRGNEAIDDGVNLRLPSGSLKAWGNSDFDVNLMISDGATDQDGQFFFDIFNTDGFLGDMLFVNYGYKPFMEVLPRKYRFRILSASMSRFIGLALVNSAGTTIPIKVIATDGNLLPRPVELRRLDVMGTGERLDVVIDFRPFAIGERLRLINTLEFEDGRGPKENLSIRDTLRRNTDDPGVGDVMEFRIARRVQSVDVPGYTYDSVSHRDRSQVPSVLTEQIPVQEPVRERVFEFKRGGGDSRDPTSGECFPSCPSDREEFPWGVRINGEDFHSLNANRISALIPRPGEIEHWTLVNDRGGWDHPVHMHFEEALTLERTGGTLGATERLARKDVWRLGKGTSVKIQMQFGEYGGAYVTHCHNTVHEDSAMLMRFDVLTDPNNPKTSQTHVSIIPTPNPTPDGVTYAMPEILPGGNPFDRTFNPWPKV
jgi:FtsP/CotA-like multicopper oxidase with cupredoxin domain